MRIRRIENTAVPHERVRVQYVVESDRRPDLNHTLWYELPEEYLPWVTDTGEPAVAAEVMLAMLLGESVDFDGPLSPRFAHGVEQFSAYFSLWFPQEYTPVTVAGEWMIPASVRQSEAAPLLCFSGGVDSFHALLHYSKRDVNHAYRPTHGLFLGAFDIPEAKRGFQQTLADQYKHLLSKYGITLLTLDSNIRSIYGERTHWLNLHGAALISHGLLLAGGASGMIIGSTNRYSLVVPPVGSNPITDPQLGHEGFDVVHYGSQYSRTQKIQAIMDCPDAHTHLRVCFQNLEHGFNCGRCYKCRTTMFTLYVLGKLNLFSAFPENPGISELDPAMFGAFNPKRYPREISLAEELSVVAASIGNHSLAKELEAHIPTDLFHQPDSIEPEKPVKRWLKKLKNL